MKILKGLTLVIAMSFLAIGCGSGGGGGSSSGGGGGGGSTPGISYTGNTSQATVTQSNAQDLSVGAYQQGQTSTAIGAMGVTSSSVRSNITRPRVLKVSQVLNNAIKKIDVASYSSGNNSGAIHSGAIVNDTGTFNGDCGGGSDYNINVNDSTGDFSGTLNFKSYCSDNVTISGSTSFSGKINMNTGSLASLNISFSALSAVSMGDSLTLKGSIASTFTGSSASMTVNLVIQDNNSGQVYMSDNFVIAVSDFGSYADISISGLYYDPINGYVVISTPLPLRFYGSNNWPSQGVLLCTGTTGTKARLTATSSTQFMVEADTDGNGSYDYNSGSIAWSSL